MKLYFALCASAMAAILGGCAYPTQPSPEEERIARLFRGCMHEEGLKFIREECVGKFNREQPELKAKAQKIYEDRLNALGADFKLLNAIWGKDAAGVKNALSLGANVNREFTTVDLLGSRFAQSPNETTTPAFEVKDLEIFETLVLAGANLHWVQPSQEKSIIAYRFNSSLPIDGLVLSERAFKLGYRPSAEDLATFKRSAEVSESPLDKERYLSFYNKALTFSSKSEKARAAVVEADNKEDRIRKQKEDDDELERIKEKRRVAQVVADEMRNSQMRAVGVVGRKVCTKSAVGDVYIGNVVAVLDQRIEVYITSAFPPGRPDLEVPGFRPYTVWESVFSWTACN